MGLCMSSGSASVRSDHGLTAATAMVLLPTGELREYPRPATAARVLEESVGESGSSKWFLCDADSMGFEGPMAAVGGAEDLRLGQIYFVLPSETRSNGLRREDIAALAVTVSAALIQKAAGSGTTSSGIIRGRRAAGSVAPLVFAPPEEEETVVSYKAGPAAKRQTVSKGRSQQRFAPDLSAISECDASE